MTMPLIPKPMLKAVCKIGQGADCCRYIVADGNGLACAKHVPELVEQITVRVNAGAFIARSDNCEGLKQEETA